MVKLFYEDGNEKLQIGEVVANHSMSIEDVLGLLDIDMDKWSQKQGFEDWDYENLKLVVS